MVAEVSSFSRMVDTYKEEGEGKTELVTLDLLGGCGDSDAATAVAAAEVNLELQIRASGDIRLAASVRLVVHTLIDLLCFSCARRLLRFDPPGSSGFRRIGSFGFISNNFCLIPWSQSAMLPHQQTKLSPANPHLHDLSLAPPWLFASSPSRKPPPAATAAAYHSVCTLEKVKSALERESRLAADGRAPVPLPDSASPPSPSWSSSSSAPATTITTSSSSAKRRPNEPDETDGEPAMAAAACPECLLYVLIYKVEPRCPRCAAHVPVNGTSKKPRIDLNFSFQTERNE
ncbi:hypothetical protein ZIOFF_049668 [Zingiber officinale]|uniref:Uncharacterized protein n=1 Tax=Zingiber officinale TaxID=94328 RepID=A0A8J5FHY6_ZINOF|nr:hypothetical protein ZIOFF_049668 [Zingiber officinale]